MSAPSRPKPIARKPAVGGASANLDRGVARQRPLMAAVALPVEAPLRRAIAPVGVHTGRVLCTAVTVATTAEAAPRRAIAPARPTAVAADTGRDLHPQGVGAATAEAAPRRAIAPARPTAAAVDTGRVLRTVAGVLIQAVAAVITVEEAEALFAPAAAAASRAAVADAIANSL